MQSKHVGQLMDAAPGETVAGCLVAKAGWKVLGASAHAKRRAVAMLKGLPMALC